MSKVFLGCIADDFTGATDLANNLVRAGMRCVQTIGVPQSGIDVQADAIVVALKSRTVAATEAVEQSLAALRWLQTLGVDQIYFKYCSTFDSTAEGNIGPVTEALLDALHGPGQGFTIVCPAFPANQRTVYKGHLFVGDVLLSDSGIRHHPLTPMTGVGTKLPTSCTGHTPVSCLAKKREPSSPGPRADANFCAWARGRSRPIPEV